MGYAVSFFFVVCLPTTRVFLLISRWKDLQKPSALGQCQALRSRHSVSRNSPLTGLERVRLLKLERPTVLYVASRYQRVSTPGTSCSMTSGSCWCNRTSRNQDGQS